MNDSADLLAGLDPARLLALSQRQTALSPPHLRRDNRCSSWSEGRCDIAGGTSTADVARPERSSIALSTVLAALVDDDAAWTREVPVRHVAAIASAAVASLDRAGLLA